MSTKFTMENFHARHLFPWRSGLNARWRCGFWLKRITDTGLLDMIYTRKLILDVLKPHQPNALEFCRGIATAGGDYQVRLLVIEMDEKTETVQLVIKGEAIDFESVQSAIEGLGGSLHSIDEVEVCSETETAETL